MLCEDKRQQLLNKSKHADDYKDKSLGKNRYDRRLKSKVSSSVREFNSIDMNKFFKDNILTVNVKVQGETNKYFVKIKFGGILDQIHNQLNKSNNGLDLRVITRALINAFNSDDVYIHCNCPDYNFRFSYWSMVNDLSSDPSKEQQTNGMGIQNPNDTKGSGCKHILLVLSNNTWLIKVASVIYNYINYMSQHYQKLYSDVIYPAIYQKDYEEPVQLDIEDSDELLTDEEDIDASNVYARTKSQFKPGTRQGIQFASDNSSSKQLDIDSISNDE